MFTVKENTCTNGEEVCNRNGFSYQNVERGSLIPVCTYFEFKLNNNCLEKAHASYRSSLNPHSKNDSSDAVCV